MIIRSFASNTLFYLDGDLDTIGSESVVSFDTAEQSFVSESEVGESVSGVTSVLTISEENPESLALAVRGRLDNNNTHNHLRLQIPTNNPASFTNQFVFV